MYRILCKPKEVDPIKLILHTTNKCFDSTQIYNQQQRIQINRIKPSVIATLPFLLKTSITAISLNWRNDTPTFCQLTEFIPTSLRP